MNKSQRQKSGPTEDQWSLHKMLLRSLYFDSTLPRLMKHMAEEFGFIASKNQYERRFKDWEFRKNLTIVEREHILRRKRKRNDEGRKTQVTLHGVKISNKRMEKEEGRYTLSALEILFSSPSNAPSPVGLTVASPPSSVPIEFFVRKLKIDNLPCFGVENFYSNRLASLFRPPAWEDDSQGSVINPSTQTALLAFLANRPNVNDIYDRFVLTFGNDLNSKTPTAHTNMAEWIQSSTLERYIGEAEDKAVKIVSGSRIESLQEFLKFVIHSGSNSMTILWDMEKSRLLSKWVLKQNGKFLERLLQSPKLAVQAFLESLVSQAERMGDKDVFRALVYADKHCNLYRGRREDLLCVAVKLELIDVVRWFLNSEKLDLNRKVAARRWRYRSTRTNTLLGAAWNIEIVEMLIEAGANLNTIVYDGETRSEYDIYYAPVYHAVCDGNADLFKLFIDNGAYFDIRDFGIQVRHRPESVLACAIRRNSVEVVNLLFEQGVECKDYPRSMLGGRSELQYACYLGRTEVVKAILDTKSGRSTFLNGRSKWAHLRDAAIGGHLQTVEMLIAAGADVSASAELDIASQVAKIPSTALMAAVEKGHTFVVEFLLGHGAEVNTGALGRYGTNVLAVAELLELHEITSLLKKAGAIEKEQDDQQLILSLQFASARKHLSRVRELLATGIHPGHILDCSYEIETAAAESWNDSETNVILTFLSVCGREVNARGPRTGQCALERAILAGDVTLIQKLADAGADFKARSSGDVLLLQVVLSEWRSTPNLFGMPNLCDVINFMLQQGADIDEPGLQTENYRSSIGLACCHGDYRTVELLLSTGKCNLKDVDSGDIMMRVIERGRPLLKIQLLLHHGAEINAFGASSDGYDSTALQAAVATGSVELIQFLLERGADINAPAGPEYGRTALQVAVDSERGPKFELTQMLIDNGADIHGLPAENGGTTALQAAASRGYLNIALMLLELGADPNADGSKQDGRTALEGAAENGRLDMVQLLFNAGAEPTQTAVDFAEKESHFVIADMIKRALEGKGSKDKGRELYTHEEDNSVQNQKRPEGWNAPQASEDVQGFKFSRDLFTFPGQEPTQCLDVPPARDTPRGWEVPQDWSTPHWETRESWRTLRG